MALENLSDAQCVRRALAEYDRLGRDAFLSEYGFGKARGWMLEDNGREYDAKAIAGVAHGYQYPDRGPLGPDDFHGGDTSARVLRKLGFPVASPTRNPAWTQDELILALELYMRRRPIIPGDADPEVIGLSQLLNQLGQLLRTAAAPTYRNANGVAMKLQNYRRLDPQQNGRGLPAGGKREEEVWATFASDLGHLRVTAAAIRAAIEAHDFDQGTDLEDEAEEGRLLTRLHTVRERDREIIRRRKEQALKASGKLVCEACGFDFGKRYGERGHGFIECHHAKPISELRPGDKTKLADLILLCSNCHRMVHVSRPWLSLRELKAQMA